ncbi:AbiH family protein [Acinetobacter brisouii]|uniref:AbiH family protein n=1 Tax=Acinetobacter brisouii TaxID=396323 RepID=UPI00124FCB58|nr:AbiH family protein [Acinetobacter brisouii]
MNILIVGNGFDLSHYLPTKYDHFMDVMGAIEQKNTGEKVTDLSIHTVDEWMTEIDKIFAKREDANNAKYQMNFDELFSKTRDPKFIEKTKEFYLTDQIELSYQNVLKLQYRLELNCWYQYFKNHVEEIKTWIDFETKIEDVLMILARFITEISSFNNPKVINKYLNNVNKDGFNIRNSDLRVLKFFNLISYKKAIHPLSLNNVYYHGGNIENGFNAESFLSYLNDQLEDFIELFNFYLEEVVKKLKPKSAFQPLKSDQYDLNKIDQIYSFNYTQTYLDFYNQATKIDFLHGKSGEKQNMVLGVSELKGKTLKKIKAYGFTKYHQKLMKNTNYGFLNHNEEFDNLVNPSSMREGEIIQINIWGHSLDVSDEDYIQEIFSFNQDEDQYVRVIVFYFNHTAKFSLLANLLHILKKEKVEHWMKQGWLIFKPNPDVAQLNQIQPVELAKNES